MILNREKHRIFFQCIQMPEAWLYKKYDSECILKTIFQWFPCGQNFWSSGFNHSGSSYKYGYQPYIAQGIYLGPVSDITNKINNNKYEGDPESLSFLKGIEYPRARIRDLDKYQLKRNTSKFDALVIPNFDFTNFISRTDFDRIPDYNPGNPKIFYSPSKDAYYFVDFYPTGDYYRDKTTKQYLEWCEVLKNSGVEESHNLEEWVNVLRSQEILEPDAQLVYEGNLVIINDKVKANQLEFIMNYSGKFIFIDEVEKLISGNHPDMTKEDLKTIARMLQATDPQSILLTINLLNSYNISKVPYSVAFVLIKNRQYIREVIEHNVETKYLLDRLDLTYLQLRDTSIRNHIREVVPKMDKSSLDYQWYREMALEFITKDMNESIDLSYRSPYQCLDLEINVEVK